MKEAEFLQELKEMDLLQQAMAVLEWDSQTKMPAAAEEYRSEVDSYLSGLYFNKLTGPVLKEALNYFEDHLNELSTIGQQSFTLIKKEVLLNQSVPKEVMTAYTKAVSKAHGAWSRAREAKDFHLFRDALQEIISLTKELLTYQKQDQKNDYDVLLDQYEPDMTCEKLDQVFAELKAGIMKIRQTLTDKGHQPDTSFLQRPVAIAAQKRFVTQVVKDLGYDFSCGRLDETIHPFATGINHRDVRITSRWQETDFSMGILSVIHEGGHGIYEQNIAEEYEYTPLHEGASMGIHESQSLFYELIIAGNPAFWQKYYPFFQECCEGTFDDISLIDFYRGLKFSQASLIRIEADSLTYPLHIIIRYELEKDLFNGDLTVDELPQAWNDKYQEYLGITPPDDLQGILQDVHWSGGMFGYFPSYALGYMYAAQLFTKMSTEFDVKEAISAGEFAKIRQWLTEKVHHFGRSKTPAEIILAATGEPLNPQYLLKYLQEIYFDAYQVEE